MCGGRERFGTFPFTSPQWLFLFISPSTRRNLSAAWNSSHYTAPWGQTTDARCMFPTCRCLCNIGTYRNPHTCTQTRNSAGAWCEVGRKKKTNLDLLPKKPWLLITVLPETPLWRAKPLVRTQFPQPCKEITPMICMTCLCSKFYTFISKYIFM